MRTHSGICFNDGDNKTPDWFPQGITTVADAQADKLWGANNRPILVSWYDHNNGGGGATKGVRISFISPENGNYRHVLLVYPTEHDGLLDYDSVRVSQDPSTADYGKALHAGGILWYGNYLFVADTGRGFRMFDMRRIFDLGKSVRGTTDGKNQIGYYMGMYYGFGYKYIMPQIGSWTRTAATGSACSNSDRSLSFSYVSLDRSGTDHLVAGEYCKGTAATNGRVVSWKIAGAFNADGNLNMDTGYRWHADNAYKLPVSNVQGATRFNGKWYLSRSNGTSEAGILYITEKVTDSTKTLVVVSANKQWLPIGPEDLSHWPKGTAANPSLGNLWTVSEHKGNRMVYSVIPKN